MTRVNLEYGYKRSYNVHTVARTCSDEHFMTIRVKLKLACVIELKLNSASYSHIIWCNTGSVRPEFVEVLTAKLR